MSTKVENMFNLSNFREHPENKDYQVFFFYNMEQAHYFETQLLKENIAYESFLEKESKREMMLFAVHRRDFRRAVIQNDLSFAAFKKPFIPNSFLRYSVLIITIALILFALAGYFMSNA
jgi:hypothetical protein